MLVLPVARGRFYHRYRDDLSAIWQSFFADIKNANDVVEFEAKFALYNNRQHCTSFAYARTGFYYALKSLGLPKGSKVVLPSITIKAILDVVLSLELEPIFVDSDVETATVDIHSFKKCLEQRPKVFLLTYLFGVTPTNKEVIDLCNSNEVLIIEDFSQCLNGSFENFTTGRVGVISIYSSSAVKTLDTYGGGHVLTDDPYIAEYLYKAQQMLPNERRFTLIKKIILSFIKNILTGRFFFPLVFRILILFNFFNYAKIERFFGQRSTLPISTLPNEWFRRFSSIQAKVGARKLIEVKQSDALRIKVAKRYLSELKDLNSCTGSKSNHNVYWQFIVIVEDVRAFRKFLYSAGIDSARTSLVLLTDLPKYGISINNPGASKIYNNGVYLPCYPSLTDSEQSRIIQVINDFMKNQKSNSFNS